MTSDIRVGRAQCCIGRFAMYFALGSGGQIIYHNDTVWVLNERLGRVQDSSKYRTS